MHATLRHKVTRHLGQHCAEAPAAWRAIVDRNEDLLTSTVFERLAYLAGPRPISILLRAATFNGDWRPAAEPILESHPWPHPDDDENREPDWVFVLAGVTLVIEAKWGWDNVPSVVQLSDQARVAAVGWPGQRRLHLAIVQSGRVVFPAAVDGAVLRWESLHREVMRELDAEPPAHELRILDDIREVLERRGLGSLSFASLPNIPVEFP